VSTCRLALQSRQPGHRATRPSNINSALEPLWSGLGRGKPLPSLGKALCAADAVADPKIAAMLLKPFKIGNLTKYDTEALGRAAARYGQDWTRALLRRGHGGRQHPDYDLRVCPATGRRPGRHPGDRRPASRR